MIDEFRQGARRQGCVFADDDVHQRVHGDGRILGGRRRLACNVETHATGATGDAQMAAIVQAVEQLRAGVRRSAKPVLRLAVLEMRIDIARVDDAVRADEGEDRIGLGLT